MSKKVIAPERTLRVVVDLKVDEDNWDDRVKEGSTDKFLVGEVKRELHIESGSLWRDHEIQDVQLLEKGDG